MSDPEHEAAVFTQSRPGTEAVTQRIGAHTAQLILVAPSGEWLREVLASLEDAHGLCERLGVAHHDTWPDELRRTFTSYRRSPEDWARAPYPERRA
jgi:hypothetical protein